MSGTDALLNIVLRLVDEVSSGAIPAEQAMGKLEDAARQTQSEISGVETRSSDAATQLGRVKGEGHGAAGALDAVRKDGIGASQSLDRVEKKADEAAGSLKEMLNLQKIDLFMEGLGYIQQAFEMMKKGAQWFRDEVHEMAEKGDKDAQALEISFGRLQQSVEAFGESAKKAFLDNTLKPMEKLYTAAWIVSEGLQAMAEVGNYADERMLKLGDSMSGVIIAGGRLEEFTQRYRDKTREAAEAIRTNADRFSEAAKDAMPPYIAGLIESGEAAEGAIGPTEDFAKAIGDVKQAAEDAALELADAKIAIYEFGQGMDEAMADGATVDEVTDLAREMYDVTEAAKETGKALPTAQIEDMKERSGALRDILMEMDIPQELKDALLAYLKEVNENLLIMEGTANRAGAAIPGGGMQGPGGGTSPEPIWEASGGIINEPVVGHGMVSGQTYVMGEAGPEEITPLSGGRIGAGGGVTIYAIDVAALASALDKYLERRG